MDFAPNDMVTYSHRDPKPRYRGLFKDTPPWAIDIKKEIVEQGLLRLYQVLTFNRYDGKCSELQLVEAFSAGQALVKAMDVPDEERAAFDEETKMNETPLKFLPLDWKQWVVDNEETSYIITLAP